MAWGAEKDVLSGRGLLKGMENTRTINSMVLSPGDRDRRRIWWSEHLLACANIAKEDVTGSVLDDSLVVIFRVRHHMSLDQTMPSTEGDPSLLWLSCGAEGS